MKTHLVQKPKLLILSKMEKATKVSLWKEEAKRDLQREDYNAKGKFQKHPPTHKKRLAKILYHSGIRIAGAAGASKDQSLRKELTFEADFSSSSTACWQALEKKETKEKQQP
jgi:hypothetical protein